MANTPQQTTTQHTDTDAVQIHTAAAGFDASRASTAFERVRQKLAALPADRVAAIRIDAEQAAILALRGAELLKSPKVRERFARLPGDVFDPANIEILPDLAWATWHAHLQYLNATARTTQRQAPAELVDKATALKTRMLTVCGYYFDNDERIGPEVVSIRAGTGYRDLASDLMRLAQLYTEQRARLQADTQHWRASDEQDARQAAERIIGALAALENTDERTWADWKARAFTLLLQSYEEVAETGRYLFRNDPAMAQAFPSLYAVVRGRARDAGRRDGGVAAGAAGPAAPPIGGGAFGPVVGAVGASTVAAR